MDAQRRPFRKAVRSVIYSLGPTRWSPLVFLVYQVAWITALVALMVAATRGKAAPPSYSWDHVVPLWVPWAGALGGSTISVVGVVSHSREWDGLGFAYWHLARPILGMITGSVAVLVLLFVLKGIAPDVIPASDENYTPGGTAVLFVIAFVVGYREETFRELVKRVVDVLLGPGEKAATQRLALVPGILLLQAEAAVGGSVSGSVTLFNNTQDTFDLKSAGLKINGDPEFTVTWTDNGPLGPGDARAINVTWTPDTPPVRSERILRVEVGGYSLTATVRATVS
ncbi:hypothetical protein SAMN05421678_12614 [Actinopolymorpha cephalotaxi]|uniref:Uncharacterized protein n=1 Tax=Actinopolymorpha cephalotaxi TaxID=504797 RepID=A0A1I3BRW4_9ACTN|nr:hypothetical protein [Actinopolymorpha cephalotaxi]NYH83775.1 hypothetical protein [Actinopolymorpha cephalotaxi]SFH64659.1 hypothetical protein SAMN05421678_12614 [Actinopolymorpha cephalotaxi]